MTTISQKLKELRKNTGISIRDVCAFLAEKGYDVSEKTMYSYESGQRMLNADLFLLLCSFYNCEDILYEFGYTDTKHSTNISDEALLVAQKYTNLSSEGKDIINGALGLASSEPIKREIRNIIA